MGILNEAAAEAIELDSFSPKLEQLIFKDDSIYAFFKRMAKVVPASFQTLAGATARPSVRVPFRVQSGSPITQGTGDGTPLGIPTGSKLAAFNLSPVFLSSVTGISWLAEAATRGGKRSEYGYSVRAEELKNSFDSTMQGISSLCSSDGSGALDIIPVGCVITTGGVGDQTSSIGPINSANSFQDQQVVDFYTSEGGTLLGSATISYADGPTNTLFFSTALPGGVGIGTYIYVNGAGAIGQSLLGLRYWHSAATTGFKAGVNLALYPNRLTTPNINLGGNPVTMGLAHRAETLLGRALGPKNPAIESSEWVTGPEMAQSIASLYYGVLIANAQEVKGDAALDMGKRDYTPTFGGRKLNVSWTYDNFSQGRLDLVCPEAWTLFEMQTLDLYMYGGPGGSTVFPLFSNTGQVLTSNQFSYVTCFNLALGNTRAALFIQNAQVPQV
jgi:hypothetical protein